MQISSAILKSIKNDPLYNNYFEHANRALESLKKIDKDLFCPDHVSMAINTLERYYKGFILSAETNCTDFSLPSDDYLTRDHNLKNLYDTIQRNFPKALPSASVEENRNFKSFLRDARREYTAARYQEYPEFEELQMLIQIVEQQRDKLFDFIKEKGFEMEEDREAVVESIDL